MSLMEKDPLDVLPMQDEMDSPEESPYLRRQKSLPVRRSRLSRPVRVGLLVAAILLPLGCALYVVAAFALTSPHFVLRSPEDITVTGNHVVSREEVLGALGLPLMGSLRTGTNVFRMSLDKRQRGVEKLTWVRSAAITRILPHGLLVHITERTPVAYVDVDGRVSLVDEDGVFMDKPESGAYDFPVVHGLDSLVNAEDRRPRLAHYMDFMRQLGVEAPRAGWMISEISLADEEDLKALLIRGQQTVQAHFGDRDYSERFRNFLAMLPEIQKSNDKIDSVDLRYHNQIVVDPQSPAPPAEPTIAAGGERKD